MADAVTLITLLESAAGYALFEIVAFDEIGSLLEGSMDTVTDVQRFGRAVKLKAFLPFKSAADALENINAISEHAMTDALKNFLEINLPTTSKEKKKSKKTASFALGVTDPALATAITEGIGDGIQCRSDDTVREIVRGCRLHLETFIKSLSNGVATKASLGLGHSYSRSKVKFNPARSDNMIIQSIALLDQLDKDVNTFAMRVREWYSWHFPELKDIVKDNIMFARAAAYVQDKNTLLVAPSGEGTGEDDDNKNTKLDGLIEILGDEDMAKDVMNAAKTSMGMDCSIVDMMNISNFTQRMVKLAEFRKQLSLYLTDKMNIVAPNLSALIGDTVGARLISKAGSLTNLAKAPASTVQILGAEKALFRALKTKGNTPKYGLIYHSTFIGRADSKNKGRISRYLANKCSIATRIDSFSDGTPSRLYGERLRDQVEERLKFYETGQAPKRNIDVMEQVAKELKAGDDGDDDDVDMKDAASSDDDDEEKKKKKSKKDKKKKKKDRESVGTVDDDDKKDDDKEEEDEPKKKKKKKRKSDASEMEVDDDDDAEEVEKTPKKKKRKSDASDKEKSSEKKAEKSTEKKKKKKKKSE